MQQLQQHIRHQKRQIGRLRERVERLEQLIEICITDPDLKWLYGNREERMDPAVAGIFDPDRAKFHLERYRFAAQYTAGHYVADIACGTGYGCYMLATAGMATDVLGIDQDQSAIDYARRCYMAPNIDYRRAGAESTGLRDESVSVIVSFETLEHVTDPQQVVGEFARILEPGGTLICSTPNAWPLTIAPHHRHEFDRHSFTQLLSEHFEQLELFNQNSGSDFEFNRGQPQGIIPTTEQNHQLAECLIAIVRKP